PPGGGDRRQIPRFIDKVLDPSATPLGLVVNLHLLVDFAVILEPAPVERKRETRPGSLQLHHLSGCVRSNKAQAAQHHEEEHRTTVFKAHAGFSIYGGGVDECIRTRLRTAWTDGALWV